MVSVLTCYIANDGHIEFELFGQTIFEPRKQRGRMVAFGIWACLLAIREYREHYGGLFPSGADPLLNWAPYYRES